ncbi:MAG: DUF1554 domain-containing protein [Leptospira sp.]|nr:DUF1554 domain-containing protein [Leptospira sp.]
MKKQRVHKANFLSAIIIPIFFSYCSIPFPEAPIFELLLLTDGNYTEQTTPEEIDNRKFIFITQDNFDGNLAGISGADGKCATEKNTNFSGLAGVGTDYKALLVTGTTRRACSTANCGGGLGENIDWVIKTNTEYFRSDGLSLFTSNAAGIFVFGNMNNPFSLNTSDRWWTGLDDNWVNSFLGNCDAWESNSNLDSGNVGEGNTTGKTSLINNTFEDKECNLTSKLLCVRQ